MMLGIPRPYSIMNMACLLIVSFCNQTHIDNCGSDSFINTAWLNMVMESMKEKTKDIDHELPHFGSC